MHNRILLSALVVALGYTSAMADESLLVYFGTYTGPKSKGVYVSRLDLGTGKLSEPMVAGEVTNPSFVALHPSGQYLYAVGEAGGKTGGTVTAFAVDRASGKLTQLNQQSTKGNGPCHVSIDKAGRNALVANYGSGSAAVLPIGADGKLAEATSFVQHAGKSVNVRRQAGPHAHSINLDAANRFAFVADLGLDKVMIYRFDGEKGTITANEPAFAKVADGAGPRHFAFHPGGQFAYVINEMFLTVTAFKYSAEKGELSEIQTISTLPAGESVVPAFSTAEVQVHPSGKFLYGSNRGHDTIAIFTIDQASGKLTAAGHVSSQGKTPRNFGIDPTGRYLIAANQGTHNVVVYKIDQMTGGLTPTGSTVEVGSPVCVKFLKP